MIINILEQSQFYQLVNSSKHSVVVRGQHLQRVVGGLLSVLGWCDRLLSTLLQLELLTIHHVVEARFLADVAKLVSFARETDNDTSLSSVSEDRVEEYAQEDPRLVLVVRLSVLVYEWQDVEELRQP